MLAVLLMTMTTARARIGNADSYDKVEIKAEKVAGDIYMLTGEGGNMALSAGPDGAYLVDTQFAPLSNKIKRAIAKITNDPIKFVINTHWHFDHVGGNENFARDGAMIIAQDEVYNRMKYGQRITDLGKVVPPAARAALPVVTFKDSITIHMNNEDVKVLHVDNAHTDGDVIVYWPEANVIHAGDAFFNGFYPFIDNSSEGGVEGMLVATSLILSMSNDWTKIIPGHGPLGNKADLQRYHDMLTTIVGRTRLAKGVGKSLQSWISEQPFAEYDAEWGDGFLTTDMFVKVVWDSI